MKITVNKNLQNLIRPLCMLSNDIPDGTVFQMYEHGKPSNNYFITCGINERVIEIWWNEEENRYRMSSSDADELNEYLSHITVKKTTMTANLVLGFDK